MAVPTREAMGVTLVFFFQAEDGIRDLTVTGVQTCALPISRRRGSRARTGAARAGAPRDDRRPSRCGLRARDRRRKIGRASCWERGEISVVAVSFKKKRQLHGVKRTERALGGSVGTRAGGGL